MLSSCLLLSACNEPPNPLLGRWQHTEPAPDGGREVVEFTPSTMRIGDRRITVVYQQRDNRVRVSLGKHAMIYTLVDGNTISYADEQRGTVTLHRLPD
jgi:hypothetical protein